MFDGFDGVFRSIRFLAVELEIEQRAHRKVNVLSLDDVLDGIFVTAIVVSQNEQNVLILNSRWY